jgi:hypothetical protein
MPSHRSHGRVYVEPPRHDEMPPGGPDQTQASAGDDPRENGKLRAGARNTPRKGGLATRGHTSLSHRVPEDVLDEPGRKRVRSLRKALSREYAQTVGRGTCGVGASLLLKVVAVASEMHEQALRRGDEEATRKHAETIRTTLAYAREECARVGEARTKPGANGAPRLGWRVVDDKEQAK